MALNMSGSCHCGAVSFRCESHTPQPYQRCYCSICRKTAGGGGYAINLGAITRTLKVNDPDGAVEIYRANLMTKDGSCTVSAGERSFCSKCAAVLWLYSPEWPELVHPFASAIDTELPTPPQAVHMMVKFKPEWVCIDNENGDEIYEAYPEHSLEDWHKKHGLWIE